VDLVLGVDHPRLVVLVMSPRSLNASSEGLEAVAAEVTRSPYGRAALSRLRPLGALRRWTLDHVRFVGAASAFKTRLLEGTSERLKVRATGAPEYAPPRFSERPRGAYDPLLGFRPAREMPISPYLLRVGRERMGDWRTAPRYERALRQTVARIRRAGAEVLLANAPARPELLALLDDPPADLAAFREALRRASRKLDVPLVLVPQDLLPAEDFADLSHPDRAGAELWTSWLADRILETFPDLERGPS
jgi:hypothetical protein